MATAKHSQAMFFQARAGRARLKTQTEKIKEIGKKMAKGYMVPYVPSTAL